MLDATAQSRPDAQSISDSSRTISYSQLARAVLQAGSGFITHGVGRSDRVAVWLPKCNEKVIALYGAIHAGGIAVPINAKLKAPQVAHILRDSSPTVLVTTSARLRDLLANTPDFDCVRTAVTVDDDKAPPLLQPSLITWTDLISADPCPRPTIVDTDVAALFYTSGSTGKPKGVAVSHRNMVVGARSVSSYLGNSHYDHILAVLSIGFDYGFSQLTTAFAVGARVTLLDYATPQHVLLTIEREQVTGLAAVPTIWTQLANLRWPDHAARSLRYVTNSGGAMPQVTLAKLRHALPRTKFFLMYGLTEAFRSTYLPPEEIDRRPESIGKAIPGAEILVLRPDGTACAADEPGELVHRGSLVSLGYWNDPASTSERFRPAPRPTNGPPCPELAVWSGDIVRRDAEGYLYFIGRKDDLIKTSGFRVSPLEIEEEAYSSGLVADAVAMGLPHPALGHGIVLIATSHMNPPDGESLMAHLRRRLPRYMVPLRLIWRTDLPRTPNGKIARATLRSELACIFSGSPTSPYTDDFNIPDD